MAEMLGVIKNGTRFLIGGGGSSAEDIGVRYDEENDMVQLYYDGQWLDWKSGGMSYPIGTTITFDYIGDVQQFEIPATGYWKIELDGASSTNTNMGRGGKTILYESLQSADVLFICVGGKHNGTTGGYNGGGSGHVGNQATTSRASGGGGATHVATVTGTLATLGNTDYVLGVAGSYGGYSDGYPESYSHGGGLAGQDGLYGNKGYGGTQSAGGANCNTYYAVGTSASFGQGATWSSSGVANFSAGGGGGGLYGGGISGGDGVAGGGSGYVKHTTAITVGGITYTPSTVQGGASTPNSNGSCKFTYLGR